MSGALRGGGGPASGGWRALACAGAAVLVLLMTGAVVAGRAAVAAGPLPEATVVITTRDARVIRYRVEVAEREADRQRGLMFRRELPLDHGMLFLFERDEVQSFWMRNTYVPLDMVFIAADGTIVRVAADTVPLSTASVSSGRPCRFVLEVNAGQARARGFAAGDRVRIEGLDRPDLP